MTDIIETSKIEKELHAALDQLIAGCEELDMDKAFGIFHDSPEFRMMGTDGALCGFRTYLQNNIDYLSQCKSFRLQTYGREVRVLDQDTAVYAWTYGVDAELKTGEKDHIDRAGASFLFRRIASGWKTVYYHESSVPLIRN